MSDPIFLRSMLSGSVYAEQMNSAQIQGQQSAKERATRVRQEAIKDEQAMIKGLEDAVEIDIREREGQRQQAQQDLAAFDERNTAEDPGGEESPEERRAGHIDLTA